jgi:gamma-tubulin complex component 2
MQTTKELEIRAAMGHSYSLRQRMIHFVQNLLYYVSVEVLEQHWHELDKKIRTVKTIDEVMEHHNNFLDTCLKECLLTNQTLHKIVTKLMATCLLFANEMKSFYDGIDISQGKDEEMGSGRSPRVSRVSGVMSWDFSKKNKKKKKRRGRDSKHNDDDENVTIGACEARKSRIEVQSQHIKKHVTQQSYVRMLRGFRDNFDSLLKRFIAALRDETHAEYHLHLANMFTRLNYNHFYSMD